MAAIVAAFTAALTLGVGTANAGLSGCSYGTAGQWFAPWGDSSTYVPIPGGTFESGSAAWALSGGAKIVSGNEPYYLNSRTDQRSLVLPPGSSALSPGVCLTLLTPSIRAVGAASDGSGVQVTLYTKTLLGLVQLPSSATIDLSNGWNASSTQYFLLQNVLGLVNLNSSNIYFRFTAVGGATVQLDDVYLDPYFNI